MCYLPVDKPFSRTPEVVLSWNRIVKEYEIKLHLYPRGSCGWFDRHSRGAVVFSPPLPLLLLFNCAASAIEELLRPRNHTEEEKERPSAVVFIYHPPSFAHYRSQRSAPLARERPAGTSLRADQFERISYWEKTVPSSLGGRCNIRHWFAKRFQKKKEKIEEFVEERSNIRVPILRTLHDYSC